MNILTRCSLLGKPLIRCYPLLIIFECQGSARLTREYMHSGVGCSSVGKVEGLVSSLPKGAKATT